MHWNQNSRHHHPNSRHPGNDFASKYDKGFKWCPKESLWLKTGKIVCPNCHMKLRYTPLNKGSKTRILIDAHGELIA